MKLKHFKYVRPANLREIHTLLNSAKGEAKLVAGGTDLLIRMKQGLLNPATLISIKDVPELHQITYDKNQGLILGAGVTLEEIAQSSFVQEKAPGLADAASLVGARQHQAMGTLGGNLALETRCWFYNQSAEWRKAIEPCLKLGGKKCHVAPKNNNCSASFAGDTAPILIAHDALVKISSLKKERIISLNEFYSGNGENPNLLKANELLSEIIIPPVMAGVFAGYRKLRTRESIEFAQAGLAVKYRLDKDRCLHQVRIVVNAMAAAPFRVADAEEMLEGNVWNQETVKAAAQKVQEAVHPVKNMPGSVWHRRMMACKFTEELLAYCQRQSKEGAY